MSIANDFPHQKGTTLIEVLIAAIIIGIGLLGIASLQVKSLQASTNAEYRAKATDLAWSLADRMRTNLNADNTYITGSKITACPAVSSPPTCSSIPGASAIPVASSCSPQQIAQEDLQQIFCSPDTGIESSLPAGTLEVACADIDTTDADSCSPGSQMTITIEWSVRDDIFGSGTDRIIMPVIPGAPE